MTVFLWFIFQTLDDSNTFWTEKTRKGEATSRNRPVRGLDKEGKGAKQDKKKELEGDVRT